jgi:hypothetical protein
MKREESHMSAVDGSVERALEAFRDELLDVIADLRVEINAVESVLISKRLIEAGDLQVARQHERSRKPGVKSELSNTVRSPHTRR